jgi:hypothetical protein
MEKILRADPVCTAPATILSRNLCQPIYYEKWKLNIQNYNFDHVGRDSVVGIAPCYRLNGPGIEFRRRRDFSHPSRQALRPTQPPMQYAPEYSSQ